MANPYLTYDQFRAQMDTRDLLDLSGDANVRGGDELNIADLIDLAAAELDSYLDGRVALPIADPPLICRRLVGALTKKLMFGRRNTISDAIRSEIDWAEDWLKKFSMGMVNLPGVDRAQVPVLQYSGSKTGQSKFDNIFGNLPAKGELGNLDNPA